MYVLWAIHYFTCKVKSYSLSTISFTRYQSFHLLCYSVYEGNVEGKGPIRKHELVSSSISLGIRENRVTSLRSSHFNDGMKEVWNVKEVENVIKIFVAKHGIRQIVTFDKYGISGHPNHIACFNGLRYLQLSFTL